MKKSHKIIYWASTIWLALGMTSTGLVQLIQLKEEMDKMSHLGYPSYFISYIGIWKLLGVVAILIPKFGLLKEWAYAGFFFTMLGALVSHFIMGDAWFEFFGTTLLLVLTVVSWYFRPDSRRLN
ncbi:MAG: DoxX family protein [Bacteroidia bacterium]